MTTVFVHALTGRSGKWSTYTFPFSVEAFAQLGDRLYIRSGDRILVVTEDLLTDDVDGVATPFGGTVWWPYVDFGVPAATKQLEGFDLVASGKPSVSVMWDQRDMAKATTPYAIDPDTWPGGIVPLPLMAPSFSVRIDFEPGYAWKLQSLTLYVSQSRGQP